MSSPRISIKEKALRYKFGADTAPKGHRYILPSMPSRAPVTAPKTRPSFPVRSSIRGQASGELAALRRVREASRIDRSRRAPAPSATTFNVHAPQQDYRTLATFALRVADSERMPGLFGDISLRIDRDAVDLGRVSSGLMNHVLDHNTERPCGRIVGASIERGVMYATSEIADVPDGHELLGHIDAGLKLGCSPGFLINDLKVEEVKGELVTRVLKWEPYEISSTAIPRGRAARIVGRASMGIHTLESGSQLATLDDLTGLSLIAARSALEQGQGSVEQRRKLEAFFSEYDRLIVAGATREQAIGQARQAAGI